ncbi:MAG: alpha/beta fold hydrolase [Spirochaetota bacterium]|jgi:carboxylesterase|nr:alpha/beta fold hydrolase [Spirochaetota bacterium]
MWIIIIIAVVLFILWNTTLIGYRDVPKRQLESNEQNAFSENGKPIIYKGGHARCVLMVHGFPSTPSMYSYSAKRIHQAGFDVYVPLLPGFGTDPKDLENTTFMQWFDYLCRYYENLRGKYGTMHVIGTSMGGAMTLKLAERYCSSPSLAPSSIVSIAAPVVYNSIKDGIFTDLRQYVARTIALFIPSIGARIVDGNQNGSDGGQDWVGYGGLMVRPGLSFIASLPKIRKDLNHVTCPLFALHDRGDTTIPFKNLSIIQKETRSSNLVSLETDMKGDGHSRHALLSYYSVQESLTDRIIAFMEEHDA